jgi:hypothetical protein
MRPRRRSFTIIERIPWWSIVVLLTDHVPIITRHMTIGIDHAMNLTTGTTVIDIMIRES